MFKRTWFAWMLTIAAAGALCSAAWADLPVPIQTARPVALDKLRIANPAVLPLTGRWRFKLTHGEMTKEGYRASASGPVTASSSQQGHAPIDALTGAGDDARWCASGEEMPQWWQVDLGKPTALTAVNIRWEFAGAAYSFKVETANDSQHWTPLAARSNAVGGGGPIEAQRDQRVRYIRITVLAGARSSGPVWASIRHVSIRTPEGEWKPPAPKPEDPANRDAFARPDLDDSGWPYLSVPWNWEMAGFSMPTYNEPDDAVGLYRREIDLPASFRNRQVIWHFEGVWDSAEIFINGRRAGYHESGFTAFDMDVTPFVRPGRRNLLAVRVCKTTPSDDLDTGDYWSLGGIYRDTYLVAVSQSHISSIKIVTNLHPEDNSSTLGISVGVTQTTPGQAQLHAELFHADGTPAGVSMNDSTNVSGSAGGVMQLRAKVARPLLWSAEKPNLYYVVLTYSVAGKVEERAEERFGFREIQIKNGVVLWNGVPIKCTGTCRHEEWSALGHALNENAWRTDLRLMKACNINAVRTSHYNHAGRFLELCDEVGIYVLDEVPACWCNLSDTTLKPAFVQRAKETLDRDQNKPCVLAWSLANESGYGPNAAAMLEYVKGNDPTRPAFVSQCGPWNNPSIDFVDVHYPSIEEVKRLAADPMRKTTPVVMTEQPHIFYVQDGLDYDYGEKDFWGQVLARNWDVVWPTESILGSFIWEWQDQGITDKFQGGERDKRGLRGDNHKGIVDGYRNIKPEYWNIKMVYSPVIAGERETAIAEDGKCAVTLSNRYSFTNLSELTCNWQDLAGSKVLKTGSMRISCAPRAVTSAGFPSAPGMDALRIEFIHPDGRSIYAARLNVKGAPLWPPAPPAGPPSTASIAKAEGSITASASGSELCVDTRTGAVRYWRVDGADLLVGPVQLNLGEQRANHGDHGARNFVESSRPPVIGSAEVSGSMRGEDAVIVVRGLVSTAEDPDPKARVTLTYAMRPTGELAVKWELAWGAAGVNCWELGLKLNIARAYRNMTWARTGLWTEYPPGHIGALTGTAAPEDLTFRCTKRDILWIKMADGKGNGLCALPLSAPVHARAQQHADGITLYLCSAIAPPYDFSTNLLPDKLIHLSQGDRAGGEFLLRPVGGN